MFTAPGGAAFVYALLCVLTEAGRAFLADKHTMALVVPLATLVKVARAPVGDRRIVEAGKGLAGLDEHQVRR